MKHGLAAFISMAVPLCFLAPSAAQTAAPSVVFIFDSSGSMKRKIEGGESRSEAAKRAMSEALAAMPAETSVGLFMYGHRRSKDCTDMEMVSPPSAGNAKAIAGMIEASAPKGETPIAASLVAVADFLKPLGSQSDSIVLVTDGVEECGGDPCAAAQAIRDLGIGLKAHVVGFTLNEDQRKTLQCIADQTGGKYFDAQDSGGLSNALAEVQKVVAETPPPPAEPVRERFFFDDFDGADLAETWVVNNPNPDGYIVENGSLLMVNGAIGGFSVPDTANLMLLESELPDGDWDLTVAFNGEFKSLKDVLEIGLRTDEKNYLSASVVSSTYNTGSSSSGDNMATLTLSLLKVSNGTATVADKTFLEKGIKPANPTGFLAKGELVLSKRGRSYAASLAIDGEKDADGNQVIHQTDALTSLRAPGKFSLAASKHAKATGEFQVSIDSVEIETVKASP